MAIPRKSRIYIEELICTCVTDGAYPLLCLPAVAKVNFFLKGICHTSPVKPPKYKGLRTNPPLRRTPPASSTARMHIPRPDHHTGTSNPQACRPRMPVALASQLPDPVHSLPVARPAAC